MTEIQQRTVALSCILFTLEGCDVAKNMYVEIFLCWLSQLAAAGGLTTGDALFIHTDMITIEHLNTNTIFQELIGLLKIPVEYKLHSPPANVREGMMWKYDVFNYEQDVFFYCDIDILILKSVHLLADLTPDETILVQTENNIMDPNYSAAFTAEELAKIPTNSAGISAGKFLVRGKALHDEFCAHILSIADEHPNSKFYTVEQPFFVKAAYRFINFCNSTILEPPVISINWGYYEKDKTILLDNMGEPGNGPVHLEKQRDAILLLHASQGLV
jgi:hypothetical protein